MQSVIAAGEVGKPVSAVLQSRDPAAPPFDYVKGGGGLYKDMGEIWEADQFVRFFFLFTYLSINLSIFFIYVFIYSCIYLLINLFVSTVCRG